MTLKRPFDATTLPALVMKIMKGTYDPVPPEYSSELKKLLMNMLHLDPNQRPTAAQIMSQPFMINCLFGLYVDIGSIPCTNSSKKLSKSSTSISSSCSSESDSYFSSVKKKDSVLKIEEKLDVLYFQNNSSNAVLLPPPPKSVIKSVSLGVNKKIGLTSSGLLITWDTSAPCISFRYKMNVTMKK